ncbi:hypothetical protein GCM10009809_19150 [Isoptericola hypogeus]|uniref:D-alanyl-D-alanine carboxypeptidase-like core domain-containing protein n=1 Tax=Isoptericola hypogeus TaxID=300179 RepID=A0ABP4VDZ2_9MICO
MVNLKHARTAPRRGRAAVLVVLGVVGVVLAGVLTWPSLAPSPSSQTSASTSRTSATSSDGAQRHGGSHGDHLAAPGEPGDPGDTATDAVTVLDDSDPDVANLDPALLGALRAAATDAADDGVTFHVTSGWRSAELQDQLFREAVAKYGSAEEAARWVATADTSSHVSGDAVDLGPTAATAWLSEHGAAFGLCQTYANEPWHYELHPDAADDGCPAMYPDPTHDPRMQQ